MNFNVTDWTGKMRATMHKSEIRHPERSNTPVLVAWSPNLQPMADGVQHACLVTAQGWRFSGLFHVRRWLGGCGFRSVGQLTMEGET